MPHDPMSLIAQRGDSRFKNLLRNKLQQQAATLERKAKVALHDADNRDNLRYFLGAISTYLDSRQALLPHIASDGYIGSLKGCRRQIQDALQRLDDAASEYT